MEHSFWHQKWSKNEIGFHQGKPNKLLLKHVDTLSLDNGSRLFLPLCGKTLDIGWLLAKGYQVAGAELSELAIEQLFADLDIKPEITETGALKLYRGDNIDIFVGDIFDLTGELLGAVNAIYDRAALIALPDDLRRRYAEHLRKITATAPQLLITLDYDQSKMPGPPFSVPEHAVQSLYRDSYRLALLQKSEIEGGFRGNIEATEAVWHLETP